MKDFKTVKLQEMDIAYWEIGKGRPVLMLHGIISISCCWEQLIKKMPGDFRFIILDLKSQGYSEKVLDDRLSPFDQVLVLKDFIEHFDLKDILLVGHAVGGCINLLSVFNEKISERVSGLVIINSAGLFLKIPDRVLQLAFASENTIFETFPQLKHQVIIRGILEECYHDKSKVTNELVEKYTEIYELPQSQKCRLASFRQFLIANFADFYKRLQQIKIKTLIIWGEEDKVTDVENAFHFLNAIPGASLKIIPACGHAPQEECPAETARFILEFLGMEKEPEALKVKEEAEKEVKTAAPVTSPLPAEPDRKISMRRLFKGHWGCMSVIFLIMLKALQTVKMLKIFAQQNGWRKITQIFLRKEHSKFCLASFRLSYLQGLENTDERKAKLLLISKLFSFIKNNPIFHWSLEHQSLIVVKRQIDYIDIIVADFDDTGKLLKLDPHFDNHKEPDVVLSIEKSEILCNLIVDCYNQTVDVDDKKRVLMLNKKLKKKLLSLADGNKKLHRSIQHYSKRILQGTVIHFYTCTEESKEHLSVERLATPDFNKLKHPGEGLLNIFCRFSPDIKEADLWFQYHHVPVDGMPMQEMLEKLKEQWGSAGPVVYPALDSPEAEPEIHYAGEDMYRGRVFCDFTKLLAVRKKLNKDFYNEMIGPAPLPALLMWAITSNKKFEQYKFSMPVDTATLDPEGIVDERNISLIFIQPHLFYDEKKKYCGLLDFIREFNYQIYLTRLGKSESYEFIELAGMLHPGLTAFIRKLISKTFNAIIGNAGLTIIKNAEMFITPLTELQSSGFIAIGNCRMPTADGKYAGAISVCGDQELVDSYVNVLKKATDHFENFIDK